MVDKRLLYWMQRAVLGQAFDCCDLRAVFHDRERQAGIDPAAIDQNRAGAALAVIAALLRSGQADMDPQRVKKGRPRCEVQLFRHTIDMKRNRHFGRQRQLLAFIVSRR